MSYADYSNPKDGYQTSAAPDDGYQASPKPATATGTGPSSIPGIPDSGYPFIQAKNYRVADRQDTDISWLVIHCTTGSELDGAARNNANVDKVGAAKKSAHYYIDNKEIIQCVLDKDIAFAAYPKGNAGGLHFELVGKADQTRDEWQDEYSKDVLSLAAGLIASKILEYTVPLRWLTVKRLQNGLRGIVTHKDISDAFKESNHYDPGPNFPKDLFLEAIKTEYAKLGGPLPVTDIPGIDDLPGAE